MVAPMLSVIVPVYNEQRTVRELLRRVARLPLPKEILVVDDGSRDGTAQWLRTIDRPDSLTDGEPLPASTTLRCWFHDRNRGKGAAIRTALPHVTGRIVIIQDADLEYDPRDYAALIQPILEDRADVVYGSRLVGGAPHRVLFFWHAVGNSMLTLLCNLVTNLNLTDMETGYKVFRAEVLKGLRLRADRFEFEPEVTIRVARQGWRMYELPISYAGRTYGEGKKVTWRDGIKAIGAILWYAMTP